MPQAHLDPGYRLQLEELAQCDVSQLVNWMRKLLLYRYADKLSGYYDRSYDELQIVLEVEKNVEEFIVDAVIIDSFKTRLRAGLSILLEEVNADSDPEYFYRLLYLVDYYHCREAEDPLISGIQKGRYLIKRGAGDLNLMAINVLRRLIDPFTLEISQKWGADLTRLFFNLIHDDKYVYAGLVGLAQIAPDKARAAFPDVFRRAQLRKDCLRLKECLTVLNEVVDNDPPYADQLLIDVSDSITGNPMQQLDKTLKFWRGFLPQMYLIYASSFFAPMGLRFSRLIILERAEYPIFSIEMDKQGRYILTNLRGRRYPSVSPMVI